MALDDDCHNLVIGTDDEIAMHKAISSAFANSTHILRINQLKKNVDQYLEKHAKVDQKGRKILADGTFKLLECDDTESFDAKSQ